MASASSAGVVVACSSRRAGAGVGQLARVDRLVIVGGERERNQDRRLADHGQLGERRRAGAGDDDGGVAIGGAHVVDEGAHVGGDAGLGVALRERRRDPSRPV